MYLHPWAVQAGVAAVALPFIVHWLTRPTPTRLPLSTVRFVQEIIKQRRTRHRLRDLIILLLRASAVVLFALAIARPLTGTRSAAIAASQDQVVKVVLLDVSNSMSAVSHGIQAIERARSIAARHVEYQPNTQSNLIFCAAVAKPVFDRPSTNVVALMDELSQTTALPQRLMAQTALNSASDMLSRLDGEGIRRELIIISDFQRSNWSAADFSVLPVNTRIELQSVAAEETPVNLAILRITPQGRIERSRPFRLEVEVGNFSSKPRQITVEATIEDKQFRLEGTCAAGGNTILGTEVAISSEGWKSGEARLVGIEDGLSNDNRRSFVVRVHPRPTYLLMTRQPAEPRPSSSYFLERAIVPNSDTKNSERIIRADPSRVDRETIMSADVLVLDHPGKLSDETIELICAMMLRGRGVFYVAAEPIDATNLRQISKAAGTNLQLPVEFSPPAPGIVRRNLFLADIKFRQVPFTVFGEDAAAIMAPIRFAGGLATRRQEGALADDILASYNDQSSFLVLTSCGAGALVILNCELAGSNLPSSPAFVPLMGELVNQLLRREPGGEVISSGEPFGVYLPSAATPIAGLQFEIPDNSKNLPEHSWELHEDNVGVMWQTSAAGEPGIHRVRRGQETVYAAAVTIPAEEADLMTLSPDLLTNRLAGGREVNYRSAGDQQEPVDDPWTRLAIACVLCLCAELAGLQFFRC